jgi:predicted transcriptional regulator
MTYYNLSDIFHGSHYYAMVMDCLAYRQKGTGIKEDKWQRHNESESDIFYGWVNLDSEYQKFTCVMKSHINTGTNDEDGHVINIPPGHAVIYHQKLLHLTTARAFKNDSYLLNTIWRITDKPQSYVDKILDTQATPSTIVGSTRIVAACNVYLWSQCAPWALVTLKPDFLEEVTNDKNNKYYVPSQPLKSLSSANLMYRSYMEVERAILRAHKSTDIEPQSIIDAVNILTNLLNI